MQRAASDAALIRSAYCAGRYRRRLRLYEARRTGLGREFLRSVRVAFVEIARGPEQDPITLDDIRKLVLRYFPYVIYFVVTPRDAVVGPEFFEPLPDE